MTEVCKIPKINPDIAMIYIWETLVINHQLLTHKPDRYKSAFLSFSFGY